MWNGKMKALTFSYDDGNMADGRLMEILDRYGMKGTFNVMTGKFPKEGERVRYPRGEAMIEKYMWGEVVDAYKGHEIASHSLTHPHLERLDRATCRAEMVTDMINIEALTGHMPVGMAYPFGSYNDMVVDVLSDLGIRYARGTWSNHSFDLQSDLLRFRPTCHHNDPDLMALAKEFIDMKPDEPKIFYVWGHTYEFDMDHNWDTIERFCSYIAGRDDIFYGTNEEVLLAK